MKWGNVSGLSQISSVSLDKLHCYAVEEPIIPAANFIILWHTLNPLSIGYTSMTPCSINGQLQQIV